MTILYDHTTVAQDIMILEYCNFKIAPRPLKLEPQRTRHANYARDFISLHRSIDTKIEP